MLRGTLTRDVSPDVSHDVSAARKGFTLIELMVILVIIGIGMGLAYPLIAEAMAERRVYNAAKEVSTVFRQQRYRAQNLNRAMGIRVSAATNGVYASQSTDSSCANIDVSDEKLVFDVLNDYKYTKIATGTLTDPYLETIICIRPNGQILKASTGKPFTSSNSNDAGGKLVFFVQRDTGLGDPIKITVPFNGISRIGD